MDLKSILAKPNPTNSDIMLAIAKLMESNNIKHDELKKCSDDIKKQLESDLVAIKEDVGITKTRVESLENEMTATNTLVETLAGEINYMKQKHFERDILISGIPSTITDRVEILGKISDIYKFDMADVESHFMKTIIFKRSGRSKTGAVQQITVTFKEKSFKDNLMSKVRSNGPLHVKQLYPQFEKLSLVISIREKLTLLNYQILKKLLELRKKKKISYCWFRYNSLHVKITTDESEKPSIIRLMSDVNKFDK